MSKGEAKELAKEYVASRQNELFHADLEKRSKVGKTLFNMKDWVDADRRSVPEYLLRACPIRFRAGRRLKVKFRMGCHPLQGSAARLNRKSNPACRCCDSGDAESIRHAMFECSAHAEIRRVFCDRVEERCPGFAEMDVDDKLRFLMADDTPAALDGLLYQFLIDVYKSRLGILAAREKGS